MNTRPDFMIGEAIEFLQKHFNVDVRTRRRADEIVIPRAALFNVCSEYFTATRLAKEFGMNHATILHHVKNHDILMGIRQYRDIHAALTTFVEDFEDMMPLERFRIKNELKELRNENEMLRTILGKYVEVDKAMDEEKASRKVRENVCNDVTLGKHQCDVGREPVAME